MSKKKPEEVKEPEEQKASEASGSSAASDASAASDSSEASGSSKASDAKPEAKPAEPDWKSLYAITLADFDNYKKRAARDREDVYRYAESDILKDILPVVDNLALALANAKDKDDEFVKGVKLVSDGLLKALADHGAKPMEDLVGKELDPNFTRRLQHCRAPMSRRARSRTWRRRGGRSMTSC